MKINDAQFNLMFSVRALSSMLFPFIVPLVLTKLGIRSLTVILALCALIGQWVFILGLETKSYVECTLSRFIFGVSDSMTILQSIYLCQWFTTEQLPIASSLLLFLVKSVRATNDNVAPIIYNQSKQLEPFFWIGFAVSVFSVLSALALTYLHASAFPESGSSERAEKKEEASVKKGECNDSIPQQVLLVLLVQMSGYGTIHAFYPNMSKFLQENYGFSNSEAGHLTSIPYVMASFVVPLFGHLLAYLGSETYEKLLALSTLFVASAHIFFIGVYVYIGEGGSLT